MATPDETPQVNFKIEVADDLVNGIYANFCSVWHGPHEFTLDFCVTGRAEVAEDGVAVPTPVVVRVKVPVAMASDLLLALSTQLASYEENIGPIKKPGDDLPLFPPGDLE